jgi:hypothetical protein
MTSLPSQHPTPSATAGFRREAKARIVAGGGAAGGVVTDTGRVATRSQHPPPGAAFGTTKATSQLAGSAGEGNPPLRVCCSCPAEKDAMRRRACLPGPGWILCPYSSLRSPTPALIHPLSAWQRIGTGSLPPPIEVMTLALGAISFGSEMHVQCGALRNAHSLEWASCCFN